MDNNEQGGENASPVGFPKKSPAKYVTGEADGIYHLTGDISPDTNLKLEHQFVDPLSKNYQHLAGQYNHTAQLTNVSCFTINKQGFITDCNLTAAEFFGRLPDSLNQVAFASLLQADDAAAFNSWLEKPWDDDAEISLQVRINGEINISDSIEIKIFTRSKANIARLYVSLPYPEAEKRKKESEEKYKTLIEQAYDGVIIYDLSGAILEFNDKAHKYLGYTHDEFEKLLVMDLFYSEDMVANPINFNKLKSGKPVLDHRRLRRKDGSGIEMEINSKMMPDGSVIVFGRDITNRIKEAAEMQRLSKIIQNSRDEIFLLSPETMLFEYANDAALKSLGYTSEELYQLGPADIKPDFTIKELRQLFKPLLQKDLEKVHFETTHRRKDKTTYPAEVYVQLIDIGDKEVFLCNTRDISEKRKAAVELAKKEKYFRTLIEHSSSAIILFDEAGNFVYQSPVVEKIVGYKIGEKQASNVLHFVHPDDEPVFKAQLNQILKMPGGTLKGRFRFKHEQGHYVWLEGSVTNLLDIEYIHALIANYQDVSERQKAEETIKAERMLLRTLIDNLPDPIFVKDIKGRKIIANKEDQLFMGLSCEEDALGKTDVELYPGESGIKGHNEDVELMAGNIAIHDREELCRDNSGKEHLLLVSRIPLQNSDGKVIGLLGIGRDITLRKKMENDLVKSNERYQYVTRATFDAVWDWDVQTGIVYRGEGFGTLFGYDLKLRNGYIGEWEDLIHRDDVTRVLDSFDTALKSKETNWQNEYRYKKSNGDFAFVMDKAIIIRDNDGLALRMVGAMQDITAQKQTVQKLVETEARFRALVENNADGIAILKENGHPSYLSPSLQRILGYNVDEAMELNLLGLVHQDDLPGVEKVLQQVLRNPGVALTGHTARIKHKDGTWHWLESTVTNMLHVPAIGGIIENYRDVTEKLQIENKIITEKELSDSLINNLPGIFFKISDSKLFRWNKNFEIISGYTPEEIQQLNASDLFAEGDRNKAAAFFARSQRESTTVTELLFLTRQQVAIPFYFNAISMPVENKTCVVVMGFDIRDRKEREEKLRISNERFEYVSKATFDAIWDWDIENKELFWGENFEKYFGYDSSLSRANLDTWNNSIHPDDYVRVTATLDKVIAGAENIWADEYRFKRLDGEYAYVQDKGFAIRNREGKAIRMIGAMHDVTEQKKDEEKVKRLNNELAEKAYALSSSNNELEKFAYVASHDLQEPLRMISSFLQLLQRKYEDRLDETAEKYIHFAVDGANRMKTLINDLLEYSRVSTARDDTGNTDMNEVMREVREIFIITLEETGAIIKCDNLPILPGTRKILMIQLMQNLVGNAIKYHGKEKPLIKINAIKAENHWLFSVTDNGIGIDPAFSEKIFVIFQRLHNKDEFSGTGIGLSICKKIVEMHGGRIWVEENKAGGSIFYFTISTAV